MQLEFTTGDAEIAIGIMREAAQWQIDTNKILWGVETLTRERLSSPAEEFHVAWAGEESAACCILSFSDSLFWPGIPDGTSGFVHKIAVRRKFAKQGIVERLIAHAERHCLARGVTVLRLDTDYSRPKLCAYYERLGFRQAGVRKMQLPEEGMGECEVALYEKDLRASNRLPSSFYTQDVLSAAPALLGKLLCRRLDGGVVLRCRITETEAYRGEGDTACHASRGRTPRNAVMYRAGGVSYVYLCYGIHNLLNIITGGEGEPQGVLVRGIEGAIGPGRVTKAMQIDRALNAADLCASEQLWLEDDGFTPERILTSPRVGIGYASSEDQARLWRFYY